jgi:hypothetical protein
MALALSLGVFGFSSQISVLEPGDVDDARARASQVPAYFAEVGPGGE